MGAFCGSCELSVVVVAKGVKLLGVGEGRCAWECVFAGRGDFEACLAVLGEREGSLGGAEGGIECFLARSARGMKREIGFGEVAPVQCAFQHGHSLVALGSRGKQRQRGRVSLDDVSVWLSRFGGTRCRACCWGDGFLRRRGFWLGRHEFLRKCDQRDERKKCYHYKCPQGSNSFSLNVGNYAYLVEQGNLLLKAFPNLRRLISKGGTFP